MNRSRFTLTICISSALLLIGAAAAAATPALDTAFGGGVIVPKVHPSGKYFQMARAAVVQPDGKVVVAMSISPEYGHANTRPVVRYNGDGTLDPSFGTNGVAWIRVKGFRFAGLTEIAIRPQGGFVVAGNAQARSGARTDQFVGQLTADGRVDTSFGDHGVTAIRSGRKSGGETQSLHLLSGGKILASVMVTRGDSHSLKFVRLSARGRIDQRFVRNGDREIDVDPTDWVPYAAGVQVVGDQAYVLMSTDTDGPHTPCKLRRVDLGSRGGLVRSFGKRGVLMITPPTGDAQISCDALVALSGGGLAVAGNVAYSTGGRLVEGFLYRFHSNGTWDVSSSKRKYATGRDFDTFSAMTQLPGGDLLIAGMRIPTVQDGTGAYGGVATTMNAAGVGTEIFGGAMFPKTNNSYIEELASSTGGSVIVYTYEPESGPHESRIVKLTN